MPTRFLFNLADYEGVKVVWSDFNNVDGIYICADDIDYPVIGLSNKLRVDERKLRCVFAHELGHHFATAGHHMMATGRTSSVYRSRNESLATRWAINLLINTRTYIALIKDGRNSKEIADYFYVLQEFVLLKGESIKDKPKYEDAVAESESSYSVIF